MKVLVLIAILGVVHGSPKIRFRRQQGTGTSSFHVMSFDENPMPPTMTQVGQTAPRQIQLQRIPAPQNTGPPGTMPNECHDWTKNEIVVTSKRQHGQKWIMGGEWQFICQNGKITLNACISSKGKEVPLNQTITEGDTVLKCWQENGVLRYKEQLQANPSCQVNDKIYKLDDTFRVGNLLAKCLPGKLEILACVYTDSSGNDVELKPGTTGTVGSTQHVCELDATTQKIRYNTKNSACEKNGITHQIGETWVQDNYKLSCDKNGRIKVLNCVTTDGQPVALGKKIVDSKGRVANCQSIGNVVFYDEFYSGTSGGTRTSTSTGGSSISSGTATKQPCVDGSGRQQSSGAKWVDQNVRYECGSDGFKMAKGCTTGDNGKSFEIPVNQGIIANGVDYSCIRQKDGSVKFGEKKVDGYESKSTCTRRDKTYKIGETWTEAGSPFKYTCNKFAAVDIIGCVTTSGIEVKVGESTPQGGLIHKCFREGNKVFYKADIAK